MNNILSARKLLAVAALALNLSLAGCSSTPVSHYAALQPVLKLQEYFNGRVEAWGMFQKRNGEVVKRFHVTMDCSWIGDVGTLDEHFKYSDGTTQRRVWTVRKVGEGRYEGTASDVIGVAIGEESGNALRWAYTLRLPVDGTEYQVQFDDWMYLIDKTTMINRAKMKKFGFELGQVTLSFRKSPPP